MSLYEFMWIGMNLCELIWIKMNLCEFVWICVNLCEFVWILRLADIIPKEPQKVLDSYDWEVILFPFPLTPQMLRFAYEIGETTVWRAHLPSMT
jgi:hypothetical protein